MEGQSLSAPEAQDDRIRTHIVTDTDVVALRDRILLRQFSRARTFILEGLLGA